MPNKCIFFFSSGLISDNSWTKIENFGQYRVLDSAHIIVVVKIVLMKKDFNVLQFDFGVLFFYSLINYLMSFVWVNLLNRPSPHFLAGDLL